MAEVIIISQNQSLLAQQVAKKLSAPIKTFALDWFADTEPAITLERPASLGAATAIIICQCDLLSRSINDHIAGFVNLISMIKAAGTQSIVTVLPYLPYARQEKTALAKILQTIGVDKIITCDIHSEKSARNFGNMLYAIATTEFWVTKIREVAFNEGMLKNLCIVSPDQGGLARAQAIAQILGCPTAFVEKKRTAKDEALALALHGDVSGRVAVIVDDIITSAKTAVNACAILREKGASSVIGCFTHAVLAPGACQRLTDAAFEKILITNTLLSAHNHSVKNMQALSIESFLAENICQQIAPVH